jgi:hypothetical protein
MGLIPLGGLYIYLNRLDGAGCGQKEARDMMQLINSVCQCVSKACNLCVGGEDGEDPVDDGPFRLDLVDRLLLY